MKSRITRSLTLMQQVLMFQIQSSEILQGLTNNMTFGQFFLKPVSRKGKFRILPVLFKY